MKDLFTEEELDKLPKWARSKVEGIQRENAELVEAVSAIKGEVTDDTYSTVVKQGYGGYETVVQNVESPYGIDILLPSKGGKVNEHKINVRVREGQLRVSGDGYPSSLVVIPQSSNVVNIALVHNPHTVGD